MNAPRVSVLIPVYNRRRYIEGCIESALAQTYTSLEIIVWDNASDDGTWQICANVARRDSRVRVYRHADNIGPVMNWRRCVEMARGHLAKLLFSDDRIEPTYLEKTVPAMSNPEVAFALSAVEIQSDETGRVGLAKWERGRLQCPSRWYIEDALFRIGACAHSPGAAIFRTSDMKKNLRTNIESPRYNDFKAHGGGVDLLLYLLTAASYQMVSYIDEPLAQFRSHNESITASRMYEDLSNRYHQARIAFSQERGNEHDVRRLLAQAWMQNCIIRRCMLSPRMVSKWFTDGGELPRPVDLMWAVINECRRWRHYAQRVGIG